MGFDRVHLWIWGTKVCCGQIPDVAMAVSSLLRQMEFPGTLAVPVDASAVGADEQSVRAPIVPSGAGNSACGPAFQPVPPPGKAAAATIGRPTMVDFIGARGGN